MERLKNPGDSAQIKNYDTLHQSIFYICQTIQNHNGTSESMRQSMIRSTMRAFIQVEDIFNICLNFNVMNNNNPNRY